MNNPIFENNPAFKNLSPEKLEFLMNFANAAKPTQSQQMAPFLMSFMNQAKQKNIQFTPSESELMIELLKKSLPPQEAKKADMIIQLINASNSSNSKRSGK